MPALVTVNLVALAIAFATGIGLAGFESTAVAVGLLVLGFVVGVAKPSLRLAIVIVTIWGLAGWQWAMLNEPAEVTLGLVRVEGVVREHRLVFVPAERTRYGVAADYTRIDLQVTRSTAAALVGQTVDMFVSGHAVNIGAGDAIETIAVLNRRPPPANPGERWTHNANASFLRVDHPDALAVTPATGWAGFRNRVRAGLADVIHDNLPPKEAGLAAGLILGRRDLIDDSVADAVRDTGTGHLLAISGMHLALFAWMLLQVVQRITRSLRWQTVVACGLMILYIAIVEPRASVQRAGVAALLASGAVLLGRPLASLNLVAAAAIVVLVIDPQQLFMPGAQLSFAAVLCIVAMIRWKVIERLTPSWFDVDEMTPLATLRVITKPVFLLMLWGILIWAATAPLAAYHFRWVTAWGAILHLLCFIPIAIAMGSLFFLIGLSLWTPYAEFLWAIPEWLLSFFAFLVESTAGWDVLSATVARPNAVLIACFYIGILGLTASRQRWFRRASLAVAVLSITVIIGTSLFPSLHTRLNGWHRPQNALRLTVISVGHGLCVLTQTPTGESVLYDAGSLASPERTGITIGDTLLALGVREIDALIISHADQDHFGSVSDLVDQFPVRQAHWHPTFEAAESWAVDQARQSLRAADVPSSSISAGDTFSFGDVVFRVLHPTANQAFDDDNANSLVIAIEYEGRRILLTGDVEDDGAEALMSQVIPPTDILLAPHHGGRTANTPEFAEWSQPSVVISSSGRSAADYLIATYRDATLFETDTDGAIFVTVHSNGRTEVESFRGRRNVLE